jgi:hypothetical protein
MANLYRLQQWVLSIIIVELNIVAVRTQNVFRLYCWPTYDAVIKVRYWKYYNEDATMLLVFLLTKKTLRNNHSSSATPRPQNLFTAENDLRWIYVAGNNIMYLDPSIKRQVFLSDFKQNWIF